MNFQEDENGERIFSIELNYDKHKLSTLSTDVHEGVLIEGTLGTLQHATFVEPEILEVKGSCGVLRVHLRRSEITVMDTANKCTGGDSECKQGTR
ncbi:MAG: hypothetical protein OEV85_10410 [Candidatus Thorarchaeota archaeon]|nr:hypothetical protein [Candidatus Thorarchaeota archaeon]